MSRRLAMMLLTAALLLAVGCREEESTPPAGSPAPPAGAAVPIVLGVSDVFCQQTHSPCAAAGRTRQYVGLAERLGGAAGRPVELRYFNTEPQLETAVLAGELDGVICKTWTAMRAARAADQPLHRLADLGMPGGPDRLEAVFFTRSDSEIKTLADLTGKVVAIGDDDAYEKSHAALRLLTAAGVKPARIEVIPTCMASALAVKDGEVDAAALSSYAYLYGTLAAVELRAVRELGRTEPIPFITVGVFDTIDETGRARMSDALLTMATQGGPADLGETKILPPAVWQPAELEANDE